MKNSIVAVCAALVAASSPALAQSKDKDPRPTCSVLDPAGKGVSKDDLELFGEAIRDAVVAAGKFRVQDRAAMKEILSQQQLNASEMCDDSCAVEQGRLLQVRYLVSSSVRKAEDTLFVSVRMTDVESGEVVGTARDSCAHCRTAEAVRLVERMARQVVTGEKHAAPASLGASTPPPSSRPGAPADPGPSRPPPGSEPPPATLPPRPGPVAPITRGLPEGMHLAVGGGSIYPAAGAAGLVGEVGFGQWGVRGYAGISKDVAIVSLAGRWSYEPDGSGLFAELGGGYLLAEAADVSVELYFGTGGWRWLWDSGFYFQLGGGAAATVFSDGSGGEAYVSAWFPAWNLEFGYSFQ